VTPVCTRTFYTTFATKPIKKQQTITKEKEGQTRDFNYTLIRYVPDTNY